MPKRVLDFDAMWGSDKLAACAEWAQGEYAWLYGLADASGSFEMTNIRVIWGRVAAIRHNLSIERLAQVFDEFHDKGLLFLWDENGKRYGHWTGSDVPGRLPAPSWRCVWKSLLRQCRSSSLRSTCPGLRGAGQIAVEANFNLQAMGRNSKRCSIPGLRKIKHRIGIGIRSGIGAG